MPDKSLSPLEWARSLSPLEWAFLLLRSAFGGMFIFTSLYHALHATELLQSIKDYALLPASLIPWSGLLLIVCEAGIGIALFFGYAVRQVAIASVALLALFTGAMISAIARGLDIACGCGLGNTKVGWWEVARDVLLVAVAVLLAWRAGKPSSVAEQPAGQFSAAK